MSSKQPPPHVTAAHAAGLAALLGATGAAAENERAGRAERHFERARRGRSAQPGPRAKPAAGPHPPGGPSNAGGAREYVRAAPTRSPVLNAFLSELGTEGGALVPANVHVFDEHALAPRLVELARQRVVSMLLAVGRTEVAMTLAQMPSITNERAARLFMRQAVHVGGDLGAITGDYARHYRRSGAPERDDQRAGCIMAAFAGRLSAMAEKLLGPHVRAELRAALEALTSHGSPPARRARASDLRAPQGAGRGALATAPRDAASSATRPRRK
ncbi:MULTISPECIES: hypothetical protein [Sorangium]|uniref:DUF2059 domain-containing protein n=1 Tax=Sorangium atrum TaxID=2995308 RepID=A0ABT5BPR4_9BACT|nr:hypothetical protein [Sorangium aterium]MDC0676144.1 hypothetical protein [Sorangium aterium]